MPVCTNSHSAVLIKTLELYFLLISASCKDSVGSYQQRNVGLVGCLSLRKKMLINFTAIMFTNTWSPHGFLPMTLCLLCLGFRSQL